MRWQVQEAKQRFSEVLRAAQTGESQVVTRHGQDIAVVIDINEYRRLRGESLSLLEYLRTEPHTEADLEIVRRPEPPRRVDLAAGA